ncbi:hypothetical protein BDV24DRAFT_60910 [Aspergillus arachidicola]|uniref:Uncharacterized protein n=1 Tax=Aspergillus arachidicola TaxID=656916 RepID=A0A5N6Y718_9EURO|nr:hypothetical protein BDV24DRAFT_60910 [Aspergillus arachidicola]
MNRSRRENMDNLLSTETKYQDTSSWGNHQSLFEDIQYSCCYSAYHLVQSNDPGSHEVLTSSFL